MSNDGGLNFKMMISILLWTVYGNIFNPLGNAIHFKTYIKITSLIHNSITSHESVINIKCFCIKTIIIVI